MEEEKKAEEVKTVDFTKVPVENVDESISEIDLSKQIGNQIYAQSKDIGESELARKIYKEGVVDITKENSESIGKFTKDFFYPIRTAIEKLIKF